MDFQFDATADGRRLKFLNVIDERSRLCLRADSKYVTAPRAPASSSSSMIAVIFSLCCKPQLPQPIST
jgi:hypothetical protein